MQNQPFSQQQSIHKILIEEAGGEESEYESDYEELSTPEHAAESGGTEGAEQKSKNNQRIFKYLTINDKMVMLPPPKHPKALTLFFEIDDVFMNTFLCDENFGYMANPAAK